MPSRIRAVSVASSSARSQKLTASTGAPYRNGFSGSTERYYSDCYKAQRPRSTHGTLRHISDLLTMGEAVATHARLKPHKLAVRDSQRDLTFSAWHERANRLANGLGDLGLDRGDR